jgi:hypothetical protein
MAQNVGSGVADDGFFEVTSTSFTANPDHIGPFGASLLRWNVEGQGRFHVEIGTTPVPRKGEMAVQPGETTSYFLRAVAGGKTRAYRPLESVTVSVDTSRCEIIPVLNPAVDVKGALIAGLDAQPDLYLQSAPVVIIAPGQIRFQLRLRARVPRIPDPFIDIDAGFGLTVQNNHLVSTFQQISVDVSVAWWLWAIPGALFGLAIAIDNAKQKARHGASAAIDGLAEFLDFLTPTSSPHMIKRNVRIDVSDTGAGILEVTACPDTVLVQVAGISSTIR